MQMIYPKNIKVNNLVFADLGRCTCKAVIEQRLKHWEKLVKFLDQRDNED